MESPPPSPRSRARWIRPALLLVGVAMAIGLATRVDLRQAWPWIEQLGPWAPLAFCVMYVVATAGLLPGTVLTLAAGAQWGPVEGLFYAVVGSNLGANLAFGIGRFVARGWVMRLVAGRPRFAAVEEAVAAQGWKIVALLRLSPVFPFNVLNYALSLTRIRWSEYALASLAGMLPGTAMVVYLGSVVQVAARPHGRTPLEWGLFAAGLVSTVAVTLLVTRVARRALHTRLPEAPTDQTPPPAEER